MEMGLAVIGLFCSLLAIWYLTFFRVRLLSNQNQEQIQIDYEEYPHRTAKENTILICSYILEHCHEDITASKIADKVKIQVKTVNAIIEK